MTDYLDLLRKNNPAGGLRKPMMGEDFEIYGGMSRPNLGMSAPSSTYGDGLGIKPPESFGQMPAAKPNINANLAMSMLEAGKEKSANMQMPQLPGGSNLTYEQLMKMYGMTGLLG
jgi:hypothetical protein